MIWDFVAPMCRGCFKWLAFLSAWYNQLREHTRPHQMTKAHFSWNGCSLMEELEEVTHFSFDYEATQPVFSEEFGCQLSTDFIHLSKSVLCHSVQQPFPYLRPTVLGRDVPANVPSATAVDAEGTWVAMVVLKCSSWTQFPKGAWFFLLYFLCHLLVQKEENCR